MQRSTRTSKRASNSRRHRRGRHGLGRHRWGKDSIWILVIALWAIPMLLAFVPHTQGPIRDGFKILNENTPNWYAQGWITMIAFAYGIARAADVAIEHFNTRHLVERPEDTSSSTVATTTTTTTASSEGVLDDPPPDPNTNKDK